MARFLSKGAVLALVIMLTGTAVIALPGGYLHELAALINKRDILVSRKPPRLIFMGGSNLLSLNSPLLERELKMPVVNMGLYVWIPTEDYFDDMARYLSPGDIVVIIQEYQSLIDVRSDILPETERLRVEQFLFLMSPCKYITRNFRKGTPFNIARIWVSLIQLKLKAFIKFGTGGKIAEALKPGIPRFHLLFDEQGDSRSTFLVVRPLEGDGQQYPQPGPECIAHLKRMIEDGAKRGVRVLYSFPPTPESNMNFNRPQITGLYDIMRKGMPQYLINSPQDQCYPDPYFADTVNHLQPKGEQIRSRKLADAIKGRLEAR